MRYADIPHDLFPDIEILEYALKLGADPNEALEGNTVWGLFLDDVHDQVPRRDQITKGGTWLRATYLMIEHGAHESIGLGSRDFRRSMDTIRLVFKKDDISQFQRLFQERPKVQDKVTGKISQVAAITLSLESLLY